VTLAYASIKGLGTNVTRNKYLLVKYYDAFRSLFRDTSGFDRTRSAFLELAHNKVTARLEKIEKEGNEEGKQDFFAHIVRNQ